MIRNNPWLLGAVAATVALGIAGLLVGFLMPGQWSMPECPAVGPNPGGLALKKRYEELLSREKKLTPIGDHEKSVQDAHRVFVSRTLVFLPRDQEPVQPMNPKQVTEDGIEVGWKLKYQFDPEDPSIASQDPDGDGFSNKEEYDKGTDPRNSASSPSKWVKLRTRSVETNSLGISFSGKSAGRYTLRFVYLGKKNDIEVEPGQALWLVANSKALEILKSQEEAEKARAKGGCPHAIPVLVKNYHEDRGQRFDEKTKTPNDYDDSYLDIERKDGLDSTYKILLNQGAKGRGVNWLVGDVKLLSLVPGEGEMGPYRVGQSFTYAGKNFVIRDANGGKVTLWMPAERQEVQILPATP